MLPGASRRAVIADTNQVPGGEPEFGMLCGEFGTLQGARHDLTLREIGHGIATGLEKHDGVLAIGNPVSTEAHAHSPAQWLDVQQSLRQWFGYEEPSDCSG